MGAPQRSHLCLLCLLRLATAALRLVERVARAPCPPPELRPMHTDGRTWGLQPACLPPLCKGVACPSRIQRTGPRVSCVLQRVEEPDPRAQLRWDITPHRQAWAYPSRKANVRRSPGLGLSDGEQVVGMWSTDAQPVYWQRSVRHLYLPRHRVCFHVGAGVCVHIRHRGGGGGRGRVIINHVGGLRCGATR